MPDRTEYMSQEELRDKHEPSIIESISHLVSIIARRRWWCIGIMAALSITVSFAVLRLPDVYASEAILIASQARVSSRFVESAVASEQTDAFFSMSRQVLSRSQLTKIIGEYKLYPELVAAGASREKVADRMRKDIQIEPLDFSKSGDIISFRVVYSTEKPDLAQQITARLAQVFIEENERNRSHQTESTTRFLGEQIDAARKRMTEQELKVRDYKMKNLEQLPQQQQALLGGLTELRIRLQSTSSGLTRAEQQRSSLRAQIGNHVSKLEDEKRDLLRKYTEKHPLVVRQEKDIARVREMSVRLGAGEAVDATDGGVDDPQVASFRTQVAENVAEIANLRREESRINSEIARSQALLRLTPVREQELTDILRDYDLYRKDYADLQDKKLNAELSASLEERHEGQQFRLIEAPGLPERPTGPKRGKISAAATVGGAVLGLIVAFLVDARKCVFRAEKELRLAYGTRLIVAVPSFETREEERRRRWRMIADGVAASLVLFVVLVVQLYILQNTPTPG